MTLQGFVDYQEIFRDCICYLDLSAKGMSGTEIYNSFGINATKNASSALTSTDRFGFANNALKFNGALDGGVNTGIYTPSAFTIVMRIYPVALGYILGNNNNINSYCRGIYIFLESGRTMFAYGDGSRQMLVQNAAGVFPIMNAWNLYTISMSGTAIGSNVVIYRNFESVLNFVTSSRVPPTNHNNLRIGSQGDSTSGRQSTNAYGEFLCFNRVLSIAEMTQIYRLTSIKYLPPVLSGVRGCE